MQHLSTFIFWIQVVDYVWGTDWNSTDTWNVSDQKTWPSRGLMDQLHDKLPIWHESKSPVLLSQWCIGSVSCEGRLALRALMLANHNSNLVKVYFVLITLISLLSLQLKRTRWPLCPHQQGGNNNTITTMILMLSSWSFPIFLLFDWRILSKPKLLFCKLCWMSLILPWNQIKGLPLGVLCWLTELSGSVIYFQHSCEKEN